MSSPSLGRNARLPTRTSPRSDRSRRTAPLHSVLLHLQTWAQLRMRSSSSFTYNWMKTLVGRTRRPSSVELCRPRKGDNACQKTANAGKHRVAAPTARIGRDYAPNAAAKPHTGTTSPHRRSPAGSPTDKAAQSQRHRLGEKRRPTNRPSARTKPDEPAPAPRTLHLTPTGVHGHSASPGCPRRASMDTRPTTSCPRRVFMDTRPLQNGSMVATNTPSN